MCVCVVLFRWICLNSILKALRLIFPIYIELALHLFVYLYIFCVPNSVWRQKTILKKDRKRTEPISVVASTVRFLLNVSVHNLDLGSMKQREFVSFIRYHLPHPHYFRGTKVEKIMEQKQQV